MSRYFFALVLLALPGAWLAAEFLGLRLHFDSPFRATVILLIAPLLEEWLFRHGLQAWLERKLTGAYWPNLLTSLVFCLFHSQAGFPASAWWMLPSLALGELWRREKSLTLNTVCHSLFNCCLWLVSFYTA